MTLAEKYSSGVGRRKTAAAQPFVSLKMLPRGESDVSVNGKTVKEYFPTVRLQNLLLDPFAPSDWRISFVFCTCPWGGPPGRRRAPPGLGLARALVVANAIIDHFSKRGSF